MATGVEQGVVALLGSKSSSELVKLVPHGDLILICCALVTITSAVPKEVALVGRVYVLMRQVFYTIALNATLALVTVPSDTGLTCVNLLGVFFFGMAVQQDEPSMTAQYVLVANLSIALQEFKEEALPIAWTLALIPEKAGVNADLTSLAQLVTVETFTSWVKSILPQQAFLPTSLLLLYMVAPFSTQFPLLNRLSRFAVFAVANDNQVHHTPLWLVASGLWALWVADRGERDGVGKSFLASAGANVAVLVVFDTVKFAMDNDPAPVLVSLLVAIRILEHR